MSSIITSASATLANAKNAVAHAAGARSTFSALSSPLTLGDLMLKNRNVMASLTRSRSVPTNVPNDANLKYYTQRAQGGCGLILSEGTLINQQGTEWPNAPGIWSEEHVTSWKRITDSVHEAGGKIFCQLWHLGRVLHPDMPEQKKAGTPVFGPSAITARGGKFRELPGQPGYVTPTEIKDPSILIAEFKHAAEQAKKAGFDGVELHSANGYLVHQFLDHTSNKRSDKWGGSVENRCRFGLEALQAIIDVWGPARVGIKMNPTGGYNDVGMPLADTILTFTHYIKSILAMKVAYIQLTQYVAAMDTPLPPPHATPEATTGGKVHKRGIPHDVLATYGGIIKTPNAVLEDHPEDQLRGDAVSGYTSATNPTPTRLFLNGNLSPSLAESLIEEGKIDAAVFGQLWIGNPDLQNRLEAGMDVGGKGVNEKLNYKGFYNFEKDPEEGYTDYPFATQSSTTNKSKM